MLTRRNSKAQSYPTFKGWGGHAYRGTCCILWCRGSQGGKEMFVPWACIAATLLMESRIGLGPKSLTMQLLHKEFLCPFSPVACPNGMGKRLMHSRVIHYFAFNLYARQQVIEQRYLNGLSFKHVLQQPKGQCNSAHTWNTISTYAPLGKPREKSWRTSQGSPGAHQENSERPCQLSHHYESIWGGICLSVVLNIFKLIAVS